MFGLYGDRTGGASLAEGSAIQTQKRVQRVQRVQVVSGGDAQQLTQGMNASPGAAVGKGYFTADALIAREDLPAETRQANR